VTRRRRSGIDSTAPVNREGGHVEDDPEQVVRTIVLRRLSSAPRTRGELEKDLAQRGSDPDITAAVLDRFEEVGLIDDHAYARMWVESRHRSKALARSLLKRELTDRGIDRELAQEAVDQIDDDAEWQRAREFAVRKFRVRSGEDRLKAVNRLAGQLARKGYPANVCFTVAREVSAAVAEQGEQDIIDEFDGGLIVDHFTAEQESV
jgi:regulatory protein